MAYMTDSDPAFSGQQGQQAPANPAYDANQFKQGLTNLYQKYYWRDPTADEIKSNSGNPGGLSAIEQMLAATPNQSAVQKPDPNAQTGASTDPVRQAVLDAFSAKGIKPRDDQDLQYWIDKINGTGGFDNAGNKSYWLDRMGQSQGGVGDYLERPENPSGGPSILGGGLPGNLPGAYTPWNSTTYGPSLTTPNAFWQGMSPQSLYQGVQGIGPSSTNDASGLLKQLLSRIQMSPTGLNFGNNPNSPTGTPSVPGMEPGGFTGGMIPPKG